VVCARGRIFLPTPHFPKKDVFPSLAGAAQHIYSIASKNYVLGTHRAGLWSEDLFKQLLWTRHSKAPDTSAKPREDSVKAMGILGAKYTLIDRMGIVDVKEQ
jgi:hypothetical protein